MRIANVVADANVLLSAVVGNAALRVFTDHAVEVLVTEFNLAEVLEYLPRMADKYDLPAELAELNLKLLPLRVKGEADYAGQLGAARSDLANRDPDDAHPLALARELELPLWSNDKDVRQLGVRVFTTAQILTELERG